MPGTVTPLMVPSGSVVRSPEDNINWPPDVLFDAVYAAAVVRHFGVSMKVAVARWLKMYYPANGSMNCRQVEEQRRLARSAQIKQRREKEDLDTRAGSEASESDHGGLDSFDVLRFLPFICMPPEAKREHDRRRGRGKGASSIGREGQLVWRDQVHTSDR